MQCCNDKGCAGDDASVPVETVASPGAAEAVFRIRNMDCPTEEKLIRGRLQGMSGIEHLQFNLIERELTVRHRLASVEPVVGALTALGMEAVITSDSLGASPAFIDEPGETGGYRIPRRTWLLMAISGVAAVGAEIVAWSTGQDRSWLVIALALTAIMTGGLDTLKKGWIALRHFSLNMNFLMSLAVIGAVFIGQWPEAAVVIFLFALAEMIEALSLDRARNAIKGLMAMSPDTATVQGASGQWWDIAAKDVAVGAIVRVKPGARIPLDGSVTTGQTTINQAPITGESMPVAKAAGDPVFAGTINGSGGFDYQVTAAQGDSTLSRIVKSVQQAQGERAPTQRFVDRFAQVYIPAVVVLAVLVAIFPPVLLGVPFQPWFYKALVLLVIACPCALVISTPVTVVSGLATAARHGILIKGGVYLEQGCKLRALAFDKTGTITLGKPVVTDVVLVGAGHPSELLHHAASLASRSDHPVSTAIVAHWRAQDAAVPLLDVTNFEAVAGRGIKAMLNGETFFLGNHRFVHDIVACSSDLEAKLAALEEEGKTAVVLCSATSPLLIVAVADTIRESSAPAIAQLRALGVEVAMLTGDNTHTARAIAAKAGIAHARGDLLPEDKLTVINTLMQSHGYVGMVGDGVNDAPALAKANVGFAMGAAGTDTALETADVALMDDDLRKIPAFLRLSASTRAVLRQNIALALGIKAVFLVLALTGQATLWMAVFADMGASLIVVANGLRLLRYDLAMRP